MHVALAERIQRFTKEEAFHKRLEVEQEALQTGSMSQVYCYPRPTHLR